MYPVSEYCIHASFVSHCKAILSFSVQLTVDIPLISTLFTVAADFCWEIRWCHSFRYWRLILPMYLASPANKMHPRSAKADIKILCMLRMPGLLSVGETRYSFCRWLIHLQKLHIITHSVSCSSHTLPTYTIFSLNHIQINKEMV